MDRRPPDSRDLRIRPRAVRLRQEGLAGAAGGEEGSIPAAIPRSLHPMSFFHYRGGRLHAEQVELARIAAEVGTPFYCYSDAALRAAYEEFAAAVPRPATICYSLKA